MMDHCFVGLIALSMHHRCGLRRNSANVWQRNTNSMRWYTLGREAMSRWQNSYGRRRASHVRSRYRCLLASSHDNSRLLLRLWLGRMRDRDRYSTGICEIL